MLILQALLVPKNFLAAVLFLIVLATSFVFSPLDVLIHVVVIVGTATILDILLSRAIFIASSSIISGLIIALLISPQSPIYVGLLASFIAIAGKHLGKGLLSRNIFNPAASGLLIASLLFNEPVSWWGVSWGYIPLILIVGLAGYLVLFKMRRYLIPFPFLITYFVILKFSTLNFQLSTILDPTIIFFSLVMLPEPTTSPNDRKRQIFYGIFVAIVLTILSSPIFNFQLPILNSLDPLLAALLLGNLLFKIL